MHSLSLNTYHSTVNYSPGHELQAIINDEIAASNYDIAVVKPNIVSALGAFPKVDFPKLRIVHDYPMPGGLGVISYIETEKQNFQTIENVVALIKICYCFANIDLQHASSSVPNYPVNYQALCVK